MDKVEKDTTKSLKLHSIGYYHLNGYSLGKGNFARVEMATHMLLGLQVAMKIVNIKGLRHGDVRKHFEREGKILSCLNHPNVVRLYETISTETLYCLVMEYIPGTNLLTFIKSCPNTKLTESHARYLMHQLVGAVKHVHENDILHRDLKLENILLNEGQDHLKLIDFGLSNFYDPLNPLETHCGTFEYAAPELFYPDSVYGPEIDMWSLGVVLFIMVVGLMPFSSRNREMSMSERKRKLFQKSRRGLGRQHYGVMDHLTKGCVDLIKCLLQPNPTKRINLKGLCSHRWITGGPRGPYRTVKLSNSSVPLQYSFKNAALMRLSEITQIPKNKLEQRTLVNNYDSLNAMFHLIIDNLQNGNMKARANSLAPWLPPITQESGSCWGDSKGNCERIFNCSSPFDGEESNRSNYNADWTFRNAEMMSNGDINPFTNRPIGSLNRAFSKEFAWAKNVAEDSNRSGNTAAFTSSEARKLRTQSAMIENRNTNIRRPISETYWRNTLPAIYPQSGHLVMECTPRTRLEENVRKATPVETEWIKQFPGKQFLSTKSICSSRQSLRETQDLTNNLEHNNVIFRGMTITNKPFLGTELRLNSKTPLDATIGNPQRRLKPISNSKNSKDNIQNRNKTKERLYSDSNRNKLIDKEDRELVRNRNTKQKNEQGTDRTVSNKNQGTSVLSTRYPKPRIENGFKKINI